MHVLRLDLALDGDVEQLRERVELAHPGLGALWFELRDDLEQLLEVVLQRRRAGVDEVGEEREDLRLLLDGLRA